MGKEGLVVEHFFKVRHAPLCICCIAMKTAAKMVADATPRHVIQCLLDHIEVFCMGILSIGRQQQVERVIGWKFRGCAQAAIDGIKSFFNMVNRLANQIFSRFLQNGACRVNARDGLRYLIGLFFEFLPLFLPGYMQCLNHARKARTPM